MLSRIQKMSNAAKAGIFAGVLGFGVGFYSKISAPTAVEVIPEEI